MMSSKMSTKKYPFSPRFFFTGLSSVWMTGIVQWKTNNLCEYQTFRNVSLGWNEKKRERKKKTVLWKTSAPWLSFERILWGTLRIFKRYWDSVAFNSMVTLQDSIHLQLTRFGEAHKGARVHSIQTGKWHSHACIRRHAFRIHDRKPDG